MGAIANSTGRDFNKNNHILHGSIDSPEKAKTEKFDDDAEERKDRLDASEDKMHSLHLHSLKKRSSMKERYGSLKHESKTLSTIEDSGRAIQNRHSDVERPAISLPIVKQDGKNYLQRESKMDSLSKLEKYNRETEGSITGYIHPRKVVIIRI